MSFIKRILIRLGFLRIELLIIEERGCMSTDWRILKRGRIVGIDIEAKYQTFLAKTKEGENFTAMVARCQGPKFSRTACRLAGENINGKIVEFV